jgi:hypothetical protein
LRGSIHYGIHEGGWQVVREPDGTTVWTSPTGHVYRVPPASYPVDNTMKIKNDTSEAELNQEDGEADADGS